MIVFKLRQNVRFPNENDKKQITIIKPDCRTARFVRLLYVHSFIPSYNEFSSNSVIL